jgi:hypothetical protein
LGGRPPGICRAPNPRTRPLASASLLELGGREPAAKGGPFHAVGCKGRIAQPEPVCALTRDSPLLQVGARTGGLAGLPEEALVEARGRVEQLQQSLALGTSPIGLGGRLVVLQLDAVAVGQPFHRGREVERLRRLHESDRIALRLAPEAVVDLLERVHPERARPLLVERAAPSPLAAGALHLRAAGDKVDHVDGLLHGLDALAADPRHRGASSSS